MKASSPWRRLPWPEEDGGELDDEDEDEDEDEDDDTGKGAGEGGCQVSSRMQSWPHSVR